MSEKVSGATPTCAPLTRPPRPRLSSLCFRNLQIRRGRARPARQPLQGLSPSPGRVHRPQSPCSRYSADPVAASSASLSPDRATAAAVPGTQRSPTSTVKNFGHAQPYGALVNSALARAATKVSTRPAASMSAAGMPSNTRAMFASIAPRTWRNLARPASVSRTLALSPNGCIKGTCAAV